jgi:gluconate 2-dehydrogenase gamma chain
MAEEKKRTGSISRRSVIASAALVPVGAITSAAQQAAGESALSPAQLRTLEAFVDRLIPKDDLGPGATECGVAVYINRSLGDYLVPEKAVFIAGLEATDAFARRTEDRSFADLSADKQDALLTAIDNGTAAGFPDARAFFGRVRRLALEGMFGDPSYGGNRNFAGWDLIRYPGPRLAVSPEDQKMGVAIKPLRASAYGNGHGH